MKRLSLFLLPFYLLISLHVAFAYEVTSHGLMSKKAVKISVIGQDAALRQALGLNPVLYLEELERNKNQKFPSSKQTDFPHENYTFDIIGLVGEGAVYEDEGARALGHFYSPVTRGAISSQGFPSPDWALEDRGQRAITILGVGLWEQNDSYAHTREFFWKALTESTKDVRERMWGRTFQGLGQVMHHLQDMAQPQHSRLDNHLKISPHGNFPFESPSLYEHLTQPVDVTKIVGDVYPPVYGAGDTTTFATPRSFWEIQSGPKFGMGIAQYVNRGFVSAGTNFDHPSQTYPLPSLVGAIPVEENKDAVCAEIANRPDGGIEIPNGPDGNPLPCVMTFIQTEVEDKFRPDLSRPNAKTSTYSIFDQDLKDYNGEIHTTDPFTGQPVTTRELFTLNRENYDEARTFLIPRAVAYSAGLINYFFRGKIAMVPDPAPNNRGGFLITNLGTEDMEGTFTLYYDDADGTRHPAVRDSAHRPVSWRTTGPTGHGSLLQAGESMPVPAFVFPPDGEPEQVGDRVLVFTGRLGQEAPVDGSVGAVVAQVIPPSPFLLSVGGVQYRSTHLDQGWQVLNASGLHIERGAYIDDTLLFIRGSDAQQYGIWQSLDGGRSFTWFILPGIQYLSDVEHLGGNEMLAIGWQQSVGHARYYTMNLGETWSVLQTQTCGGCGWNGRVTYIGHRTLLANVGLLQTTGEGLAQSTDLGLTWTDIDPVLDGQVLSSMGLWNPADWFINALVWNQVEGPGSVLLAGGYLFKHDSEGAQVYGLWKSVDEGQTWRHVTTTPDIDTYNATINSLALDRQGNALMTASDDMLYRSTDAGETWEPATPPVAGGDLEGLVYLRSHLPPPQRPEP